MAIEDARRVDRNDRRERGFDQQLRFRTRNQHIRRHLEFEPEELAHADELRDRLAFRPARFERPVALERGGIERLGVARDEFRAPPAEHVREQHARFQRRQRRASQQFGDRRHSASPSAASNSA
jgi:hypothetical protein